jgi:hypothetical protein
MIVFIERRRHGIVLQLGVIDPLGMTHAAPIVPPEITTEELRSALERVLADHFGRTRAVVILKRELAPYRSSSHLEELQVSLEDGSVLDVVFKDPGRQVGTNRQVKPEFLADPQREIETYRTVLSNRRLNTPVFYGAVVDPSASKHWLFLERIPGTRLKELGDFALWQSAARWAATLHLTYAPAVADLRKREHLVKYDRAYLERWIGRARHVSGGTAAAAIQIETLAQSYDALIERLAVLPVTLIHGEFYPSNIVVRETPAGPSVSPVDWEMAAVGPALLDLAAITSGAWSDQKVAALARAYYDASGPAFQLSSFEEFLTALDGCRLFLAVQWLGWSKDWQPPPEHAHDWLTAAIGLAKRLGIVTTRRRSKTTPPARKAGATVPGSSRSVPRPARGPKPRGSGSRRS